MYIFQMCLLHELIVLLYSARVVQWLVAARQSGTLLEKELRQDRTLLVTFYLIVHIDGYKTDIS